MEKGTDITNFPAETSAPKDTLILPGMEKSPEPASSPESNAKKHQPKPKVKEIKVAEMKKKDNPKSRALKKRPKKKNSLAPTVISILILVIVIAAIAWFISRPAVQEPLELWDGETIAILDGEQVTIEDFNAQLARVPTSMRLFVTKDMILNQTLIEKVLLMEAENQGIMVPEEEVNAMMETWAENLKFKFPEGDLNSTLDELNMTFGEFRDRSAELIADQLTISLLFNESVLQNIEVTEKEIEEYYDSNIDKYVLPETREVSHILVLSSAESNKSDEEALFLIEEVESKLEAGEGFFDLVSEYSEDPGSNQNDGIYNITRNMTVPEFDNAAFSLEVGETSPIIRTQYGYHIIRLLSIMEPQTIGYDEARESIEQELLFVKQRDAIPKYIADLMADADIKLYAFNTGIPTMDIRTFEQVDNNICLGADEKPVVILYSVSWQDASQFGTDAFEQALIGYEDTLEAHMWEVDTDDDLLTEEVETEMTEQHKTLFKRFNPGSSVPAYLIGCKYFRIGNGYWEEKDSASEILELQAIFDEILFEVDNAEAIQNASDTNPFVIEP